MDPATKLHVIYVCVLFVTALMGFANAYYDLYRKDARHFLFNADILKRQKEAVQLELETDQARCRLNILHLQELVNALVKREFTTLPESAPGQVILRSGRRYEFRCTSGAPPAVPTTSVWMYDEDGQGAVIGMLAFRTYGDPVREDSFLEIAREASVEENRLLVGAETRLASIPSDAPQVWGIWDFLYFSVVIQTTVGLGDILPNSSRIRKLVMLQVLIGISLLGVGLGIVLSSHP